jgi:acetyl-CoA acetyltransferase family protein
MVPLYIPPKYEPLLADNGIRNGQTMEALGKLRPVFDSKWGSVTAGNSSQLTDGAAAVLVTTAERAKAEGWPVLGSLRAYAYAGLDPSRMGLGPVYASARAFDRAGLTLKDMELIEINEAFSAQVLACGHAFGSAAFAKEQLGRESPLGTLDFTKVNVNGGAVALGHPVGVSGTRLVLTLLKEMQKRNLGIGLASLCVGGGQGAALILERA